MTLRDDNMRMGLLKALADAVDAALKGERQAHLERLVEAYNAGGTKSFDILLPDNTKVGTVVLTGVTEERYEVEDEAALLEWAKEHRPTALRETIVPPQPERRFTEFYPASKAALLQRLSRTAEGDIVDDDGTPVPGVRLVPAGRPTNFQARVSDKPRVLGAWMSGELTAVAGGHRLLQIGSSEPFDDFDNL